MTKDLTILGSTGSIGTQSLDVARKHGIRVRALTASTSVETMEEQVREFHPDKVALLDESAAADLRVRIADTNTKVLSGIGGICECATDPASDTVLNSIVGIAGLLPTMDAI
ncbi:MAG: 1-deoxy-D-xylulose-5-phosphate reductoisomerase, partial [Acutalibacteraceae bacterium]|nr:1-deoxy-D-xylulose-5-phosphate reductoisomerase [Acutalibacteraceae bacterium]